MSGAFQEASRVPEDRKLSERFQQALPQRIDFSWRDAPSEVERSVAGDLETQFLSGIRRGVLRHQTSVARFGWFFQKCTKEVASFGTLLYR